MTLRDIRIPVLNNGPWHNPGDQILIVRLGEREWRVGEGLAIGKVVSSTLHQEDTISVIVKNTPGIGQDINYGDVVYQFKYSDWQRIFELEISANEAE